MRSSMTSLIFSFAGARVTLLTTRDHGPGTSHPCGGGRPTDVQRTSGGTNVERILPEEKIRNTEEGIIFTGTKVGMKGYCLAVYTCNCPSKFSAIRRLSPLLVTRLQI
jgi:hypothetical protein